MDLKQAKSIISELGISMPDFMIEALLAQMTEKEACLKANYSDATILLIYSYVLALLGIVQASRYISGQSLPGGLSRSFKNNETSVTFGSTLKLLNMLDTANCMGDLIPENPFKTKKARMITVSGGCYHE